MNPIEVVTSGSVFVERGAKRPSVVTLRLLIDKYTGLDAEDLIAFLADVALNRVEVKARSRGKDEDSVSFALVPMVPPTIRERITAAEILLAYRHGKPRGVDQLPDMPNPIGENGPDYSSLSDAELATLETLNAKTLRAQLQAGATASTAAGR